MLKKITIAISLLVVFCMAIVFVTLALSLPTLKGKVMIPALESKVIVNRDQLDVPTIIGDSRLDVSVAMGFIHAQERFFQMDLLRRSASGELAAIFGSQLVEFDKSRRIHRFRDLSKRILAKLSPYERKVLVAYAHGVNSGLRALKSFPIEYKLLLQNPLPWTPEDSILVGLAMYFELQYPNAAPCILRGMIHDHLDSNLAKFLLHYPSKWRFQPFNEKGNDIQNGLEEIDFDGIESKQPIVSDFSQKLATPKSCRALLGETTSPKMKGSNQWAKREWINGKARASIACDMHLELSVPNIWYVVTLIYQDRELGEIEVSGASVPGNPCIVIGDNKSVAWGFTNAYLETSGVIRLEKGSQPHSYLTCRGEEELIELTEIIRVKGKEDIPFQVRWTHWGPLKTEKYRGDHYALSWCAYAVDSFNLGLLDMERVKTVLEAFDVCKNVRIPAQNCALADSQGNIGWCICGKLPEYRFYRPKKSSTITSESDQIITEVHARKIYNPPSGVICTANNQVLPDHCIPGCYLNPIRAYQIKERLESLKGDFFSISKMIQSDNRAQFMDRWHQLMMNCTSQNERWGALRQELEAWDGMCAERSRGYCLIRSFREKCHDVVLKYLLAPCLAENPNLDMTVHDFEEPVFKYLELQLLKKTDGSKLLKQRLTAIIEEVAREHADCIKKRRTWGSHFQISLQHPLSSGLTILSSLLDMKALPIDGDYFVPKVLSSHEGASIKLIVSYGNENCSLISLPAGQSGHPLSKSYRAFHKMWANDAYISLVPRETKKTLTLYSSGF